MQRAESETEPETVRELLRAYCTKFKKIIRDCQNDPECENDILEQERRYSGMDDDHESAEQWTPGVNNLVPRDILNNKK